MARTNTDKLKLAKHDTADLNWGNDANESMNVLDAHGARGTLRGPRTLSASLGSGAVGPNLSPSTSYTYRITALLDGKESNPNQFPSVTAAAVTQGGTAVPVALAWEATDGATGYRIYRATGAGPYERIKEIPSGGTVVYTDAGNDAPQVGVNPPGINDAAAVVTGVRKQGEALYVRGALELIAGANVTITQDDANRALTIAATGGGSPADASDTVKGITKLSVAPASPTNPIAVGDNDPRNTDARTPTAHAIGGAAHTASTFAALAALVSDATLVHAGQVVLQTLADAKGDLIAATGADAWARLPVGADGQVLTADSAQGLGVKWATAAGGGGYATSIAAAPTGTAATDTAAVQAAINALPAGGGTVVLRQGTYAINASVVLPAAKPVWILGQGSATVLRAEGVGMNLVGIFEGPAAGNLEKLTISDLRFTQLDQAGYRGVRLNPGAGPQVFSEVTLQRVVMSGGNTLFLSIQQAAGAKLKNLALVDCVALETGALAIVQYGAGDAEAVTVAGCTLNSPTSGPTSSGINVQGGKRVTLVGNNLLRPAANTSAIALASTDEATIAGNVLSGPITGIRIDNVSAAGLTKAAITGNRIAAGTDGLHAFGTLSNSVLTGNVSDQPFVLDAGQGSTGNTIRANKATVTDNSGGTNVLDLEKGAALGSLLVGSAADLLGKLAVGTNGQVLTADSAQSLGVKWATPAGGGGYATSVTAAPTGTAATDTAAVQAAVDALPAGGGTVVLRDGTYAINASVVLPAAKPVHVLGQGAGTVLRAEGAGMNQAGIFKGPAAGNLDRVTISDLHMTHTGQSNFHGIALAPASTQVFSRVMVQRVSAADAKALVFGNATGASAKLRDIHVLDCKALDVAQLVDISVGAAGNLEDLTVAACHLDNPTRLTVAALVFVGARRAMVLGNSLNMTGSQATSGGIVIYDGQDTVVSGNRTAGFEHGLKVLAFGYNVGLTKSVVSGNRFNATTSAMKFTERLVSSIVVGNMSDQAIVLDANANTTGNIIRNNKAPVTDNSGATGNLFDYEKGIAKGGLLVGSAADTLGQLAVGSNGQVLTADSAEATGLKWATPAGGGGWVTVYDQALAVDGPGFTVAGLDLDLHKRYKMFLSGAAAAGVNQVRVTFNGDATATNYWTQEVFFTGTGTSPSRTNSPRAILAGPTNEGFEAEMTLSRPAVSLRPRMVVQNAYQESSTINMALAAMVWTTQANVTQIDVTGFGANLKAGTRLIIMRPA